MDSLTKVLTDLLTPPWNYVLGAVGLLLGLAPKIMELGAGWQDLRSDRRRVATERQRLELLKLRYEIEALKAQHSLPDFDQPPLEVATLTQTARPGSDRRPVPRWLRTFPRVAGAILAVLQGMVALFSAVSAISIVAVPIVMASPPRTVSGFGLAGMALVYALMTWGSIALYRATGRWRKAIIATSQPPHAADA